MDHENKKVVKIGHNSNRSLTAEIGEDISHELQQLRKAYRRLKDKMCDNISLMLDLQLDTDRSRELLEWTPPFSPRTLIESLD